MLAQHFLRRLSGDQQPPLRLSKEAAAALQSYSFPGNVRELENALTRAAALATQRLITLDCLPPHIAPQSANQGALGTEDLLADRPTMEEAQRRYLQVVLQECGGNRRQAARVLDLDRRTIQRLIIRYQPEVSGADEGFEEE